MQKPFFRHSKGSNGFVDSALHAWRGLVHTVVHQRNMRIHLVSAVLVGLVGSGIPLGLAEKVTLIFCVLFIFFAEILNSALEALVDLAVEAVHEKARITKDAAAAGVLVLAIGTVVIFAAILVHNAPVILAHGEDIQRQVLWGGPLAVSLGVWLGLRRPARALDWALGAFSLGLWGVLVTFSKSYVFSAMLFGLWALCGAAARMRRREAAAA